jgi:hypothetical protein
MANTFSDDPRRVAYDRNRTKKRSLEKQYQIFLLLIVFCGVLLSLIIGFFAVIRTVGGDASLMPQFLLLLAGTVCGVLSVIKRSNVLAAVSALCFAAVSLLEHNFYFLLFSGAAARIFMLNQQWQVLTQAEGYPDFNYSMIEQQEREVLEQGAIAAITGEPVAADLTARRLPAPEPEDSSAARKPFRPGKMDSI